MWGTVEHLQSPSIRPLRVLLVPDSIFWVTGTIAKAIVKHNGWIEGSIVSAAALERLVASTWDLPSAVDMVHFLCPYASRTWLPRLREWLPVVTTHHHVSDWELQKHNLQGDAIMTDSREWVEDLVRRGVAPAKVVCVPPGVDTSLFRPGHEADRRRARRRLGLPSGMVVVGFFGKSSSNEYDRKGVDVLMAAAMLLRDRVPGLAFLLIGPGWTELASSLEAAHVPTVWRPFVRRQEDLARLYHALDFYWVTARVEGGPVTLLEAMSSGICCLTTPVGLAREIVRDGENAVLLRIGDATAFAEQTARLAEDPAERGRISAAGRRTASEVMDTSITMTGVAELYARAWEAFSLRRGLQPRFDVRRLARQWQANSPWETQTQHDLLAAVPLRLRRTVRRWELVDWAEGLIRYHAQRREGLKLLGRAVAYSPFSGEAWRALLRNLLPKRIVHFIVTRWRSRPAEQGRVDSPLQS